jgi:hypothetical protein
MHWCLYFIFGGCRKARTVLGATFIVRMVL